jgi:putative membrane protein
MSKKGYYLLLLAGFTAVFAWSAIAPRDRLTWLMEVTPAVIGIVLVFATHRRFEFSRVAYAAMWAHALILMVGGHYTYAEVPLFNWLRDTYDLGRNHYDRIGHFAQGFFPAIIVREILLRTSPLKRGGWLFFIVLCVCLAISAFYELTEWWAALMWGGAANAFLATQGDVWDTQWDMFLALCGAVVSLAVLRRVHDRSLAALDRTRQHRRPRRRRV